MTIEILLGCLVSYLAAQIIKNIIDFAQGKWQPKSILSPGGMPSSHVATCAALSTGLFLSEGISSSFTVSVILMAIVTADAIGVRYRVGIMAASINKFHNTRHETRVGHTPNQVAAGFILGVIVAILLA